MSKGVISRRAVLKAAALAAGALGSGWRPSMASLEATPPDRPRVERLGGWANVRDYGAVADGVTDDSASIQAAIDSGSSVWFPAGAYAISQTMQFSRAPFYMSHVTIKGLAPIDLMRFPL